jgi:hypothetical protein
MGASDIATIRRYIGRWRTEMTNTHYYIIIALNYVIPDYGAIASERFAFLRTVVASSFYK